MILMYYWLETQVQISRPYKILPYAFFFIFLLQNLKLILFSFGFTFYSNYAICFLIIYDILDYLVMGHMFYDVFCIINVSFMQLKFYMGHH